MRYLANCSLLFTELPLLERPRAAAEAGFEAIELWWPWPHDPTPPQAQVDELVAAVEESGVQLVGLNFFGGDLAGPADAGVLSVPGRSEEFRDNVPVAVEIGHRLGVTGLNALYGVRVPAATPLEQDALALENLALAARAASDIGATVLVEPLSGPKPYPVRSAGDASAVVRAVRERGEDSIGLLCDLFHLAANGEDPAAAIAEHADLIAHVQVADHPGRGEPGTGTLDLDGLLADLERRGYDGWVSLEYVPTTSTLESLAWLPPDRRGAAGRIRR